MAKREPPFDPEAFAEWLVQGLKETVSYRLKQTFDKEKIREALRSKIPTRSKVLHQLLKKGFEQDRFEFEEIRQGDSAFLLIRKKIREGDRRLVLIPGFGDSPASWLISFGFARRKLLQNFDEIMIIDFPGYLGFLADQPLTPSMTILQGMVKTVCDANPPHTLIGHSLGGWLAAKYAQSMVPTSGRKKIENLILIAPSGLTPLEERQAFADFILEGQNLGLTELLARVVYDPKLYQMLLKEEFKQFYQQAGIRTFIESVKQEEFLSEDLPFTTNHLSVIWGDHDVFVPTQWMRHWIERFGPYMDAYLMTETGHLPQLERPQVLAEAVLNTLGLSAGIEGKGWKKLQSKKLKFGSALQDQSNATKQISKKD